MLHYYKSGTCDCCGIDESLERDHINETHKDNSAGNLQTLCKHCHMQKGRMGLPLFNHIMELCRADLRMKATMRKGSLEWLRKTKDYRPKETQPKLFELANPNDQYKPYTDDEVKLIIAAYVRGNPSIYDE